MSTLTLDPVAIPHHNPVAMPHHNPDVNPQHHPSEVAITLRAPTLVVRLPRTAVVLDPTRNVRRFGAAGLNLRRAPSVRKTTTTGATTTTISKEIRSAIGTSCCRILIETQSYAMRSYKQHVNYSAVENLNTGAVITEVHRLARLPRRRSHERRTSV